MCELAAILRQLYEKQLHLRPEDEYLRRHVRPQFLAGSIRVFEFYSRHLPPAGRVLDWGCRHAPDACLIRVRRPDLAIEACDMFDADHYPVSIDTPICPTGRWITSSASRIRTRRACWSTYPWITNRSKSYIACSGPMAG